MRAEIRGVKWHDIDGNGLRALGETPGTTEPGLGGWRVFLDFDRDSVRDEEEPFRITGPNGSYSFTGLPPGSYAVVEERQPGWNSTTATRQSVLVWEDTVVRPTSVTSRMGHIRGYAFRDANADGDDDQEPRLPGVMIELIEAVRTRFVSEPRTTRRRPL